MEELDKKTQELMHLVLENIRENTLSTTDIDFTESHSEGYSRYELNVRLMGVDIDAEG